MAAQSGSNRKTPTQNPVTTPSESLGTNAGANQPATSSTSGLSAERDTSTMHEDLGAGAPQREQRRPTNGHGGWTGVLKDAAASRLSSQKHRASEGIDEVARALRDTTDRLSGEGRTAVADYARQAASQLERFSRRLDEQDLDEMVRSAQNFARSQPWVFVGAAFGLGLITARFFKSSGGSQSRPSYGSDWQQQGSSRSTFATTDRDRSGYGTPGYGAATGYGTGPTS